MIKRDKFKRLLAVAFWLLATAFGLGLVASSAQAATYYVAQSGAGDADGSSYANRMGVAAHNAATFSPGDTIYLCDTITSQIYPPDDGSSGALITYRGDLTDHAAIIDWNGNPQIKLDGRDYLTFQNLTMRNGTIGFASQGASDHITIKDCTIHTMTTKGILFQRGLAYYVGDDTIANNTYITIGGASGDGNDIYNIGSNTGGSDVSFQSTDDWIVSYNKLYGINTTYGVDGVVMHSSSKGLIEHNVIYSHVSSTGGEDGVDIKENSNNIIVRYNHIYGHSRQTGVTVQMGSKNVDIYGNVIHGSGWAGILVKKGNYATATNMLDINIFNNLLYDNAAGVMIQNSGTAPVTITDVEIYNNTIADNGGVNAYQGAGITIDYVGATGAHVIKNNILYQNTCISGGSDPYQQIKIGSNVTVTMDYNQYYWPGHVGSDQFTLGTTDYNLTEWKALGYDAHSVESDPGFTAPGSDDYTLTGTSKDNSVDLSGGPGSVTIQGTIQTPLYDDAIDSASTFAAATLPSILSVKQDEYGTGWEFGAYAYQPSTSYPDGQINTPATNTTITVGGSVSFAGTVTCTASTPCTVLWNFNGGADNSTVEDPGAVTFSTVGVYTVSFTVTDNASLVDPTPDQVTITVRDTGNDFTGDTSVKSVWRYENDLTDSVGNNDLTGANSPAYDSTNPIEGSYSIDFEAGSSQRAYIADASLDAGFPLKSDATPANFTLLQKFKLESLPADNARMMLIAKYDYPNNKRTCYVAVENKSGTGTTLATFAIGYNNGVSNVQVFHDSALSAGVNYGIGFTYHIATDIYRLRMFNLDTGLAVGTDKTGDLSATVAGGFDLNDSPLEIGSFGGGTLYFFDGLNDETVITDRAWTVEEIDAYFTGDFSSATAVIAGISSSVTSGTYGLGATTGTFTVNFNEQVDWYKDPEGTLTLTLVNDTGDDVAVGVVESSGTGYDITFSALTVPAGFNTVDLDAVSIDLTGASYIRVAGTSLPAILTVPQDPDPASLDRHGSIVIDSVAPTWSAADLADSNMSADGTYVTPGQWVYAVFDFSETIYATGAGEWPKMATVGLSPEREWVYIRKGDDADNAVFGLELQVGDRCADLGSATTIDYGTGSIRDAAGNMASTTSLNIAASAAIVLAVPKNADNGSAWWVGSSGDAANIGDLTLVPGDRVLIRE